MIKMNKVVMLLATAALATAASAQVNNWVSADGTVWKNGTNEFCWRSASWTPATAAVGCDGAIVAAAAPAPVAKPAPAPAPAPAAVAPAAAPAKVTYAADAFFGFDKAVILPAGKVKLDDLIAKVKDINLEVIVAVGHTDATGPASYNQALSVKRAGAVKAYLVSKGIDANRIYSEGKGETSPVADNSTRSGRSKNRRVEIEVVGAR
ncbi:MAG: OmpA family protein [Burkholderiaceae bacterium]|jgi:OOP family OmpA-OmpF porin|nr:Outer membrane protein II [Betaproteobacteria bacterium MOLA814]